MRSAASFTLGAVLLLAPAGSVAGQRVVYSGSAQALSGRYGLTETTRSFVLTNGLTMEQGRWRGALSVPLVMQDARWIQFGGGGMVTSGGPHRSDSMSSGGMGGMMGGSRTGSADAAHGIVGVGDPIARLDLTARDQGRYAPAVRVAIAAKAPLTSAMSGLGTGRWDGAAGLLLSKTSGRTMLYSDAYYWVVGRTPLAPIQNLVSYSLGVGRLVGDGRRGILASVSGSTPYVRGLEAPVQAGLGVTTRRDSGSALSLFASAGLTRTAPTVSVGLGWTLPLKR